MAPLIRYVLYRKVRGAKALLTSYGIVMGGEISLNHQSCEKLRKILQPLYTKSVGYTFQFVLPGFHINYYPSFTTCKLSARDMKVNIVLQGFVVTDSVLTRICYYKTLLLQQLDAGFMLVTLMMAITIFLHKSCMQICYHQSSQEASGKLI